MKQVLLACLVATTLGLVGCTPAQNNEVQQNVQGVGQEIKEGAGKAKEAIDNQTLEGKVKTVLTSRKGLEAKGIDVEAKDGVITLKGDVASPDQAQLAEQVAGEVEGVTSVVNQLTMRVPATGAAPAASPAPATHPAQGP